MVRSRAFLGTRSGRERAVCLAVRLATGRKLKVARFIGVSDLGTVVRGASSGAEEFRARGNLAYTPQIRTWTAFPGGGGPVTHA